MPLHFSIKKTLRRQKYASENRRRSSLRNTYDEALASRGETESDFTTDDEPSNQEPKEILQRIQEQKDIIANIKSRPWSMAKKLRVLNAARRFVEQHEGSLSKRRGYSEAGKEAWKKLKRFSNNICDVLTLWDKRLKTVESYFGSSVASYFVFLRWLVQINVILGVSSTIFLVVPEISVGSHEVIYKQVPESEKNSAWDLSTIWSLGGYIEHSAMFYGYYTNKRVAGNGYRLPLAYFVVGMATFAYSFAAILRKMAKNSRLTGSASSDNEFTFSWRLFSSWDFMIGNPETAENKSAAITTGIREAIVEEQEKKKEEHSHKKLKLFLRVLANMLVLLLLAGSLCSIQFTVSRAQSFADIPGERTFWEQNEVSVVVTIVTMVTPSLFELIASMENYHPRNSLRIQLARILMLYLANLYSLMIGLLGQVANATATISTNATLPIINKPQSNDREFPLSRFPLLHSYDSNHTTQTFNIPHFTQYNGQHKNNEYGNEDFNNFTIERIECWETNVGKELVKLSVIDLLSTILTILIVDFIRALIVRYFNICCCWDLENKFPEYGEFKIAENVLHLIYNQGITWIGSFFCPLLPIINAVKLTLLMYIRSWSVITCNIPHQRVFRASRSSNFYLALLLFMLFLSLLPTVWVIAQHHPSRCGPFSNQEWMYTIIFETIEKDVPSWLQTGLNYVIAPVFFFPVILLMLMMIYYLQAVARSASQANSRLKLQLHYERKEGKKNMLLIGAGNKELQQPVTVDETQSLGNQTLDFTPQIRSINEMNYSSKELVTETNSEVSTIEHSDLKKVISKTQHINEVSNKMNDVEDEQLDSIPKSVHNLRTPPQSLQVQPNTNIELNSQQSFPLRKSRAGKLDSHKSSSSEYVDQIEFSSIDSESIERLPCFRKKVAKQVSTPKTRYHKGSKRNKPEANHRRKERGYPDQYFSKGSKILPKPNYPHDLPLHVVVSPTVYIREVPASYDYMRCELIQKPLNVGNVTEYMIINGVASERNILSPLSGRNQSNNCRVCSQCSTLERSFRDNQDAHKKNSYSPSSRHRTMTASKPCCQYRNVIGKKTCDFNKKKVDIDQYPSSAEGRRQYLNRKKHRKSKYIPEHYIHITSDTNSLHSSLNSFASDRPTFPTKLSNNLTATNVVCCSSTSPISTTYPVSEESALTIDER